LRELAALFGGYDTARFVHLSTTAAIVVFLAIHIAMAIIVPQSLLAMIRSR
jgi:thiosulfate reductase cytochrome b subunit